MTRHPVQPYAGRPGSAMQEAVRKRVVLALYDQDWNQQDLADRLGVTRQWVSQFLRGQSPPLKITMVAKLAAALEVEPYVLVTPP